MRNLSRRAFSIIELLVIIVVIGIVATSGMIAVGSWQRQQASNSVRSDIHQAISGLGNFENFNGNYPPNLAGTGFAASNQVSLKLSTNAPSVGVYNDLASDQNAQLFLNTCNANLFLTPNNTACRFEGSKTATKIHTKGTNGSNTIWDSPIASNDITLDCGSQQAACDAAISSMISQFTAQGGQFPVIVPDKNVPLPVPTQEPNGPADRYCLEGRASNYPDIVYHTLSTDGTVETGECPNDPTLHYYQ